MTSIISEIINLTKQHKDLVELKYFFELQKHKFLSEQQLFDFESQTKNDSFFIKLEKLLRLFESINSTKLSELKISLEENTQYSIELDSKLQKLETEVRKSYKRQGLNYLEVLNKIQKSLFLTHIFGDYGDIAYKEFSIDGENINYYNSIEGLLLIIKNYFKENQITFDKYFFKDFFKINYYYYYFIYIKDKNEEIEKLKIFFSDFINFSNRIRFLVLLILLKSQLEDFIITILENYNYMPSLSNEELKDKIDEILKEFNIEKPHLTKYQQRQKAFLKEKEKLENLEIKLQNANISLDIDFENTDIQSFPSNIRPLIISLIQTKTNLRTIINKANITLNELENLKISLRKLPNIEYEIPETLNDKRKVFINLLIEFYKKKT